MNLFVLFCSLVSFSVLANIDLKKSQIKWKGEKVVADSHEGTIAIKSVDVIFEKDMIKSGTLVVDLSTLKATDVTGDTAKKLEDHLKSSDFLDVEKYPTAILKVTAVTANKVKADLTIKGKTQPVEFDVKKEGNAFTGTLTFDRTKFDIIYASGNFFKDLAANKVIKDEISLAFNIVKQ